MKKLIIIALVALSLTTLTVQAAQSGVLFLSTSATATNPGKFFCNVKNAQNNIQVTLANHDVVLQGIQSGGLLPISAGQLKQFYLVYYYKKTDDPLGPHVNFNIVNAPYKVSINCIDNSSGGRPLAMPLSFNVALR